MFDNIIDSLAARQNATEGDYEGEGGFLMCGKCHTPKQSLVDFPDGSAKKVPVLCSCEEAERERQLKQEQQIRLRQKISELKQSGITDSAYFSWTFERDDRNDAKASRIALNYVEHWEEMKQNNVGLLFMGTVGSGKSFLACCIANALLEKCVPVLVTNFPKLIKAVGDFNSKENILEKIQNFDLVIIDDVGVERESGYALEQMYSVIDTRYRSGKPLVVTTNLTPAELKATANIERERIYDRILEMCCVPVVMETNSRRRELAKKKRAQAKQLLEG